MMGIGQMEMRMTKLEQAVEALRTKEFATNGEFVFYLMKVLGMSKVGARTYAYNARKALGKSLATGPKAAKVELPEELPEVYKLPKEVLARVFSNIKISI
jgi:hypothetical protein